MISDLNGSIGSRYFLCTLPLIFRKNQSRHYINDEVLETVKKVWSS